MRTTLRTLILGSALAIVSSTQAQNQLILMGHVAPCFGVSYEVHIQTWPGTLPTLDTTLQTGADCSYFLSYFPASTTGFLDVSTSCDSGLTFITDSAYFNFNFFNVDTVNLDLACGGYDCNGVLNGPAVPGTACDDGNPITFNDVYNASCVCVGDATVYDCVGVPDGPALPGTPCLGMNSDSTEFFGLYTPQCVCALDSTGNYYDCLGLLNGANMPGTACDDGNAQTSFDTWNSTCSCAGYVLAPCEAGFNVVQGIGQDSLLIPYDLVLYNSSHGGSGAYSYFWDFGDGATSTESTPVHSYAGNGPYLLCLSIDDGNGCTDTYCDSVSVDDNGIFSGMTGGEGARSTGFTISVVDHASTGIVQQVVTTGIRTWPNPASETLNVAITGTIAGAVDITVMDLNGHLVKSDRIALARGSNQLRIATADLSDGIYVLRIGNVIGYTSQRFVKAH